MIASRLRAPCVSALALAALAVPTAATAQMPSGAPSLLQGSVLPSVFIQPRPMAFLERQLEYPRVQRAYERKVERVEEVLDAGGVEAIGEVFFRVFKREQELEVWVREPAGPEFTLVRTYPVCEVSGQLGPKREQGDLQVPEGFYSIDVFNPWSRFHLSMRVDYPNAVDRVRGHRTSPGGDIYIHGGCATIGCVPVTDEYIEELYLIAAAARDAGHERIPVHIFPTRLDDHGLRWLADSYGDQSVDFAFWQNLQQGYLAFERTRVLPWVGHDGDRYTFDAPLPSGSSSRLVTRDSAPAQPLGTPIGAPISAPSGR